MEGPLKILAINGKWKKRFCACSSEKACIVVAANRKEANLEINIVSSLKAKPVDNNTGNAGKKVNIHIIQAILKCINIKKQFFGGSGRKRNNEIIDLNLLTQPPQLVDRFGEFLLQFTVGDDVRLKANGISNAQKWIEAIINCCEQSKSSNETEVGTVVDKLTDEDTGTSLRSSEEEINGGVETPSKHGKRRSCLSEAEVVVEGLLLQNSLTRFNLWKARYFRLIGYNLYYYDSKDSAVQNFSGHIEVDENCSVESCEQEDLLFTLFTPKRKHELKASSREEAINWKSKLLPLTEPKGRKVIVSAEKDPPAWMKEWDSMTEVEKYQSLQEKANLRYKDCKGDLLATVSSTSSIIEELDELASECLNYHVRPDILEFHLRVYHISIEHEIGCYLIGEKFENLSAQEMLRLMDLIVAYDEYLKKLLDGEIGQAIKTRIPEFHMLENVEKMITIYSLQLRRALSTWVENIVNATINSGSSRIDVQSRENKILVTPVAVDLFNMVNETLLMARASGLKQVEVEAFTCCMWAVSLYVKTLLQRIEENAGDSEISFLCAVANDCWLITDHIDSLENDYKEISELSQTDLEHLRVMYNESAITILQKVSAMIFNDVQALINELFTESHLSPDAEDDISLNIMARICATIDDYLGDFEVHLDAAYFHKLTKILATEITCVYCQKLVVLASSKASMGILGKSSRALFKSTRNLLTNRNIHSVPMTVRTNYKLRDIDLARIQQDRIRIIECVSSRVVASSTQISAEKRFAIELQPLDDILELLTASGTFFSAALKSLEEKRGDELPVRILLEMAATCLHLRADLDREQIMEIENTSHISERRLLEKWPSPVDVPNNSESVYLRIWDNRRALSSPNPDHNPDPTKISKPDRKQPGIDSDQSQNQGNGTEMIDPPESTPVAFGTPIVEENVAQAPQLKIQIPEARYDGKSAKENGRASPIKLVLSPGHEAWENLDVEQLRQLCLARNLSVQNSSTRQDFISLLQTIDAADVALKEEGRKFMLAMSVSQLKEACNDCRIDTSTCMSKEDFIHLLDQDKISIEGSEAVIRQLLAKGFQYMENENNAEVAAQLFNRASRMATELQSSKLEAQALQSLAQAYMRIEEKVPAAAHLFQVAASTFLMYGEKGDHESCTIDAAIAFEAIGQKEEAIDCLNKGYLENDSPVFKKVAEDIRHRAMETGKKKGGLRQHWSSTVTKFFSSSANSSGNSG